MKYKKQKKKKIFCQNIIVRKVQIHLYIYISNTNALYETRFI